MSIERAKDIEAMYGDLLKPLKKKKKNTVNEGAFSDLKNDLAHYHKTGEPSDLIKKAFNLKEPKKRKKIKIDDYPEHFKRKKRRKIEY
jgi:hypothetical protein